MIPKLPSHSEETALPPRQRPNMGNLSKETTESDLWAFDDAEPVSKDAAAQLDKPTQPLLPIPRESDKMKVRQLKDTVGTKFGGNADRLSRPLPVGKSEAAVEPARAISYFEELDSWDEPVPTPEAVAVISAAKAEAVARQLSVSDDGKDEFSPPVRENVSSATPLSRLNLSKLEWMSLVALLALLCVAGGVGFFLTIHRLPIKSELAEATKFPIQGKHLTILSATSHWRAPRPTDTARRGTQLLPVFNFKSSGGPAAIRVFFRNSTGELVGDAVTRSVKEGGEMEVVATAGFDDVGMHAAYRDGPNQSWTIEVSEAATENSAGPEFKKLFVMNVATERR